MYVQHHVRVMVPDQAPGVSGGLEPPPAPLSTPLDPAMQIVEPKGSRKGVFGISLSKKNGFTTSVDAILFNLKWDFG